MRTRGHAALSQKQLSVGMNKTAIGLHSLSIRIGAAIGLFLIISGYPRGFLPEGARGDEEQERGAGGGLSLVAQGHDRIEIGGAARRPHSKKDTHQCAEEERERDGDR